MAAEADGDLARALLGGVAGAFDRFVDVYHAKIFRYSYTMCGQRQDAEEVAQETLLNVFQNLKQLRQPELLKPWVLRIARNACLMKRRKRVDEPAHEISTAELMPSRTGSGDREVEIADWSAVPEDLAANAELRTALNQAVAALPDHYKSVFLLRDVEALSTEECADVLGVSTDVVKQRLHRARLALRKALDRFVSAKQTGELHESR